MPKVSGNQAAGGGKSSNGGTSAPKSAAPKSGSTKGGTQNVNKGNNNSNAATPPAQVWNPGVENPVIQPFLTQQDIEEYAEAREQYTEGLNELDRNYKSAEHNTEFETAEVEKGRVQSRDTENWDAAGRGLFRSSIRDADLADIDATAEIKKKFLSDQLQALAVYNQGQKASMEAKWNRYMEGLHRKEASNAEEAGANMPKYSVEPHFENAPSQPQPQAQQNKPQNAKSWGASLYPKVGQASGLETSKPKAALNPAQNASRPGQQNAKAFATKAVAGQIYGKKITNSPTPIRPPRPKLDALGTTRLL